MTRYQIKCAGCSNTSIFKKYCSNCRCKKNFCGKSAFEGSTFCINHKLCNYSKCNIIAGVNNYCPIHKCKHCDYMIIDGINTCPTHTCAKIGCNISVGDNGFCTAHSCIHNYCRQEPLNDLSTCAEHTCVVNECNAYSDNSRLCVVHKCCVCNNLVSEGTITCVQHTCMSKDCIKSTMFRHCKEHECVYNCEDFQCHEGRSENMLTCPQHTQ